MPLRWPLSMALASVEGEVWALTSFEAVGLIQPAANGRVDFQIRTRVAVLATTVDTLEFQPGLSIDGVRSIWNLGPFLRAPIGHDGTELFAARVRSEGDRAGDVEALARLADRVDAVSALGEPIDALDDRLSRVDALAGALQTLESALDLRDVFGQLSVVARRVLAHDFAIVGLYEDGRRIRPHALSAPAGWTIPEVVESPYPTPVGGSWSFGITHDLARHPVEHSMPAAVLGLRSAVRVPIRIGDRMSGVLNFSAFQSHRYTDADVAIARRIAEYVALALSHHRLADEARAAAAVGSAPRTSRCSRGCWPLSPVLSMSAKCSIACPRSAGG
jgi:hypothetical protein